MVYDTPSTVTKPANEHALCRAVVLTVKVAREFTPTEAGVYAISPLNVNTGAVGTGAPSRLPVRPADGTAVGSSCTVYWAVAAPAKKTGCHVTFRSY